MVPQMNNIGIMVVNHHGVVTSIAEKVIKLKNQKETPYQLGTTEIQYPDGAKEEVLTRFYVASMKVHPEVFKTGEKIGLEIQAEGDFAGRAVAKLAGNNVDIVRLLGKKVVEDASITPPMLVNTIKDNVIESELVI